MKKLIILLLAACLLAGCYPAGEGADMAKYSYNGVILPALPDYDKEAYPYAYIAVVNDEGYAFLVVSDKLGYLSPITDGETITYNYTLGLTSEDEYNESLIIYAKQYLIALDEASAESLESFFPGISTTAWVEEAWSGSELLPEGGYWALTAADGPIWTNSELGIFLEDGTLFIEGSEPVRVFDLKSFLTGLTLGLAGKPVLIGQKTPVAYLYNGVRLPALPEWDRVAYPYALIIYVEAMGLHSLYCCESVEFAMSETDYPIINPSRPIVRYTDAISFDLSSDGEDWDKYDDLVSSSWYLGDHIVWANLNIMDASDNSVYLAASDPVPVYE